MGKTVRGPIGPPGNPGPPGPPGLPGDSGDSEGRGELCRQPPNLVMDGGLIQPLACPMSAPSRQLLERSYFEAGSLIYLQDENKLVLKTSSKWVELQVRLIFHLGTLSHDIGFKITLVKFEDPILLRVNAITILSQADSNINEYIRALFSLSSSLASRRNFLKKQ